MITMKERELVPKQAAQTTPELDRSTDDELSLTDQILHLFGLPGLALVHRQTAIALGEGMDDFDVPKARSESKTTR